ncbi:MAG: sterol desaturase family protein [Actinomycetota bacterium]
MEDTLQLVTDIFESVFVPILIVELIWLGWARRLGWSRIKEMLANGVTFALFVVAAVIGAVVWFPIFTAVEGLVPWSIPTTWWSAVLAIVLADLVYYVEHRFEHEHRLPWDLYHSVHHSSEAYDQTTGLRLGIFDALLTVGFSLPLVILGFSPTLVFLSIGIVIAYQGWIHTELVGRMPRWFEAVFNTPSHHRAHHGNDRPYLDVNYGGILIIWDRLFGTFQREIERPTYGLTTQIESSNPIDIQFSQIRLLLRDLRADRSWRTRLARLWNRPGWSPTKQPATPVG